MKNYTLIYEFDSANPDFPYADMFTPLEQELGSLKDSTLKMYWVAIILEDLLEGSSVHIAQDPFKAVDAARASTVWGKDLPTTLVMDSNPYGEGGCREDHIRYRLS